MLTDLIGPEACDAIQRRYGLEASSLRWLGAASILITLMLIALVAGA